MWQDLQYPDWINRGQGVGMNNNVNLEERKKALKMWGK